MRNVRKALHFGMSLNYVEPRSQCFFQVDEEQIRIDAEEALLQERSAEERAQKQVSVVERSPSYNL